MQSSLCIQLLAATVVSSNGCAATKQLCSHQQICAMIWQMSAMHNDEHDTAQEDNTKTEAETTAEVVTTTREAAHTLGKISDAAIVSSIVLPNLFQISITLTLPFGFPCVFTNRAGTHSVHTQSFGCILSTCASCAEYSGSWC